jgi:hypothetical protein
MLWFGRFQHDKQNKQAIVRPLTRVWHKMSSWNFFFLNSLLEL